MTHAGLDRTGSAAGLSLRLLLVCGLSLCTPSVRASAGGGKPTAPLPEHAAAVLAALQAEDDAGLKRLAKERWRGPWWIADALLAAGHVKGAKRFADALRQDDAKALRARIASPREPKTSAWHALAKAGALLDRGDVAGALARLEAVAAGEDSIGTIRVLELRAEALDVDGRSEEADAALRKAYDVAFRLGWVLTVDLRACEQRIRDLLAVEAFGAVLPLSHRVLALNRSRGMPRSISRAYANVGGVYLELARPAEALPHLHRAARILAVRQPQKKDDSRQRASDAAHVDLMLGQAHERAADYAQALAHAERARDMFAELKAHAERARDMFAELKASMGVAYACQELGNTYAALGDFKHALDTYEQGMEVLESAGKEAEEDRLGLRLNMGVALHELGRTEDAGRVLAEVHAALPTVASRRMRVVTLLNLGEVAEKEGHWKRAVSLHRRARSKIQDDPELEAFAAIRIGDVISRRGQVTQAGRAREAHASYAKALALGEAWGLENIRMLAHIGLGETSLVLKEFSTGAAHAASAMRILEEGLNDLGGSELVGARSHADRARIFDLGVRAAVAAGNPGAVFAFMEGSRARLLLDTLGGRSRLYRQALEPGLVSAEGESRERYAAALQAYRDGKRANRGLSIERRAERVVTRARAHLLGMTRRVARASRRVSDAGGLQVVTLNEAQASSSPDETLVLYALLPGTSYALVVTQEPARIVLLPGEELIAPLCAALLTSDPEQPVEDLEARTAALRAAVLEPLALPKKTRRLFVCPDGPLAAVPWDTILSPSDRAGLQVTLVPSATVHHALRATAPRRGRQRLLLGAPDYEGNADNHSMTVYLHGRPLSPLPASRKEVKAITREGDIQLLGKRASETRLRTALAGAKRFQSVHLACHGLVDAAQPFLTALALAPDEHHDGFLTALEIFTLRVKTDLVVLSACETGRGKHLRGEGLVGLAGAFQGAGAPRVIASLWKVSDRATKEMMVRFYEEWARPGVSTAAALRRAQEHVSLSRPHPYYWAGWVLWGQPE